jgi:23S rRNA-/tRNA-specific pseudouridylate synthase
MDDDVMELGEIDPEFEEVEQELDEAEQRLAVTVPEEYAGSRIDKYLSEVLPELSRSYLKN